MKLLQQTLFGNIQVARNKAEDKNDRQQAHRYTKIQSGKAGKDGNQPEQAFFQRTRHRFIKNYFPVQRCQVSAEYNT